MSSAVVPVHESSRIQGLGAAPIATLCRVERWTRASQISVVCLLMAQIALALAPLALPAGWVDRLTTLFIYGILALMWNALAGYAGQVSVGHQAFFGLGAYAAVRIADAGLAPYPALLLAALAVAVAAAPVSFLMLRLRGGEFAIGMWVLAALVHLLVNLDPLVQGETGTSLIALQQVEPAARRETTYWMALGTMAGLGWCVFGLLRSRVGVALQAIPVIGAVLFFAVETLFGAAGVAYLIGLGAFAVVFALFLPRGIWGEVERRTGWQLLPVGVQLYCKSSSRLEKIDE